MGLFVREYWSREESSGWPDENKVYVPRALLEKVKESISQKYRDHSFGGYNYLIRGGIVTVGFRWVGITHENQKGLEKLADLLGLPRQKEFLIKFNQSL